MRRKALLQSLASAVLVSGLAANAAQAEQASEFFVGNASSRYDFVLHFDGSPCESPEQTDYQTCEGPGTVEVRRKGEPQALQTLELDGLFVSFTRERAPLVNSARRYEYQGAVNVGDFNFDGQEDFALQDGNNGAYGGPSYRVYLYSPAASGFVLNEPMTELVAETLGFFEVDAEAKRLKTAAKSGCCYHEYTEYAVIDDTPQPVRRLIEDAAGDAAGEGRMTVTEETLVRGKWRRKSRVVAIDEYYRP
jgi:hypothetical protein